MTSGTAEDTLIRIGRELDKNVEELRELGRMDTGGREVAIVITNLQQARLWIGEALAELVTNE